MGLSSALLLMLFGLRPHGSSVDYPAHDTVQGFAIGAATVPADEVKKRLSVDLSRKGYVVIEVALYPESGSALDVSIDDFRLESARALTPLMVDAHLNGRKPNSPRKPTTPEIYGSATIGYESARDNVAGPRQRGGVYTATSVGVGTPAPKQPDNTLDRLEDQSLPEGKTTQPVAGYLYFPKAKKKGPYELIYYGKTEQVKLTVPTPK
jgi:hypothetical protein